MKIQHSKNNISRRKSILFGSITVFIAILVFAMSYFVQVGFRTNEVYEHIKANKRGFAGQTHIPDEIMGYIPVPGSSGKGNMMVGDPFPMHIDQHGFRILGIDVQTEKEQGALKGVSIMTMGDSYTFGLGINAEQTFSHLLGENLDARVLNAGVPGYGIAQIVRRARNLIPEHKPDYLVVQYSPWLIKRSMQYYAPAHFGKVPAPYYYESVDGGYEIADPVFKAPQENLPYDEYRFTAENQADFASFYFRVGLPLFFQQDLRVARYSVARALGSVPEPASDARAVIRRSYGELQNLIRGVDGEMLILVLGKDRMSEVPFDLFPEEVPVVNAQRALVNLLAQPTREGYRRAWWVWRGQPPRLADNHPNADAHRLIAGLLVSRIRRLLEREHP